jgi:hypothetical protein
MGDNDMQATFQKLPDTMSVESAECCAGQPTRGKPGETTPVFPPGFRSNRNRYGAHARSAASTTASTVS